MSSLVRPERQVDDGPEGLHSRVKELEDVLRERDAVYAQITADLHAFKVSYRHQVGILHEQLDEIELALAEAELGERLNQKAVDADIPSAPTAGEQSSAPPRYTSDAVRTLFRDVAKAIHPDLARDDGARDRRHSLMVEANRAYAQGDEAQLRWILQAWERSPEAVQGSDAEAMRARLVRRIAQIEEQLDVLASDRAALQDSPSWKLKTMVDEAATKGKDLVADMVRRLKRDIMVATNRLDALRPHP